MASRELERHRRHTLHPESIEKTTHEGSPALLTNFRHLPQEAEKTSPYPAETVDRYPHFGGVSDELVYTLQSGGGRGRGGK